MGGTQLSNAHKKMLTDLYDKAKRTRDDLPCTDEFDQMYAEFVAHSGLILTRHEFWKALAGAGKASQLARNARHAEGRS